jgi:formate C-acetyltransferase
MTPKIEYSYESRLERLRARKKEQTQEKIRQHGYMDEDDYGYVPAPKDFSFSPIFNDPIHKTFYGTKYWALNFRNLLDTHPVYVDKDDALSGRWMFILQRLRPFESAVSTNNLEMAPQFDYSWLKPTQKLYDLQSGIGKMHHFAPDYSIGLNLGWKGLLDKVRTYKSLAKPQQIEFYEAEESVIEGILKWIGRTIDEIEQQEAIETDPLVKNNLQEMALDNRWLLDNPPQSFKQACQWIAWYNMAGRTYNRAGAGCQLDEILKPYYERDVAKGLMDEEKAIFIVACLLLIDPHYYQIGGPDSEGKDQTSKLSFIILEAAHRLKATANITIRIHDKSEERLIRRGLEILFEDKLAYPRFSGDKALIEGFCKNGYPVELARKRIAVGCNWMSLPGLEYTLNDLVKVNLAKVFMVAFNQYEGQDVEELFDLFAKHLFTALDCLKEGIDFHFRNQYKNAPELMLNLLCHGPIEKGLDASNGGVAYYNIAIDAAGLGTVADSFAALQHALEIEKSVDWDTCREALKNNFAGQKGMIVQAKLHNGPRYGHGKTLGDEWAKRISVLFTTMVASSKTADGYLLIPGLFSWANTVAFGKTVGATPNGRFAGEPISHGANPNPGFRKDGALTAMGNAIAMVQPGYGNTAPWQLELNQTITNRDNAINVVEAVIKTHFERGGTLININVMNADTIRKAYKNPSLYPDLIVRITGFSVYFMALSPEFQKMVVDRIIDER